jgi:hypothetical protein
MTLFLSTPAPRPTTTTTGHTTRGTSKDEKDAATNDDDDIHFHDGHISAILFLYTIGISLPTRRLQIRDTYTYKYKTSYRRHTKS